MSEPLIITNIRAEIYDASDVLVKYYSGPDTALPLNVPPGGRYVEVDAHPTDFRRFKWPPSPAAPASIPVSED